MTYCACFCWPSQQVAERNNGYRRGDARGEWTMFSGRRGAHLEVLLEPEGPDIMPLHDLRDLLFTRKGHRRGERKDVRAR
jgi:hypothetical protein